MRTKMVFLVVAVLAVTLLVLYARKPQAAEEKDKDAMLVHHVYFTLKERTPEAKKKCVESCKKLLTKHEGEVFFSAGTLAEDLKGDYNDVDFDVCLTIVFKNKAAHDKYQPHKRHQEFIKENKDTFKKIRVFDSYATK
jgi:Stress responsive A/B Barrel Domain